MKKQIELNPKQLQALQFALANNGLASVLTLHRHMQCDRVTAKSIISQLVELEFLTLLANGQYMLSSDGRDYLIMKKVPGAERKATGSAAHRKASTVSTDFRKKIAELDELISAPQVEDQPNKVIVVSTPAASDTFKEAFITGGLKDNEIHPELTAPDWAAKQTPEQQAPLSKEEEWQELIHKGLARLNERLGYEPVKIDNLELKTYVLLRLAGSLAPVSTELVWLLTEISKDLRKAGGTQ